MDVIEKKVQQTLNSVEKKRISSAGQSFIDGANNFLKNYLHEINKNNGAKKIKKLFEKDFKQSNSQLQKKNDEVQKLKKTGMAHIASILTIGSLILGVTYFTFKSQINSIIKKIKPHIDKIKNLFNAAASNLNKKIQQIIEEYKIKQVIIDICIDVWNGIRNTVIWFFDLIAQGFDYIFNKKNDLYGQNIVRLIFRQVTNVTFDKLASQITILKVLRYFGSTYEKTIKFYPNLQAYIKFGPGVMRKMKLLGAESMKGTGGSDVKYYQKSGFFSAGKTVEASDKGSKMFQYQARIHKDGYTVIRNMGISEDTWAFHGEVLKNFFESCFNVQGASFADRIDTSRISSGFHSPFGQQWDAICNYWTGIKNIDVATEQIWVKDGKNEIQKEKTFKIGDLRYASDDWGFWKIYTNLYNEIDSKHSHLLPWWGIMQKQYARLEVAKEGLVIYEQSASTHDAKLGYYYSPEQSFRFTVGDYGKVMFLSSAMTVILFRLERDILLSDEIMKHNRGIIQMVQDQEKSKIIAYKSALYSDLDQIRALNDSFDNVGLAFLVNNLDTGVMRPSEFLEFVKINLKQFVNKRNNLFGKINHNNLYEKAVDAGIMKSAVANVYNSLQSLAISLGILHAPTSFSGWATHVKYRPKTYVYDNGGGSIILGQPNGTFIVKNYNNETDFNILENLSDNQTYVSSVQLCMQIISQYVQFQFKMSELYKTREQQLMIFNRAITELATKSE